MILKRRLHRLWVNPEATEHRDRGQAQRIRVQRQPALTRRKNHLAMEDKVTQPASSPQRALYQMAVGHYLSRAICLAAKLRIADLLKGGQRHFGDLARATRTDAPSLNRVMRLLASAGVFEEKEHGNFALTALGECLCEDGPVSARALVMMFAGHSHQDAWKDLEYCVRTGEPSPATLPSAADRR